MRLARIQPKLGKLRGRVHAAGPRIRRIAVSDLSGFEPVDITLNNSFLAICGGTGIGKTTLLAAIHSGLREIEDGEVLYQTGRPSKFSVVVEMETPAGQYMAERTFAAGSPPAAGYESGAFFDDIDIRTGSIRRQYHGEQIDALKEGIEPFAIHEDARSLLSQICRKDYTSIKVYEVEVEDGRIYPYFEVTDGSLEYDSETMGSGEHSACYLAWRLSTAPPGAVLCLEEPEAFLPRVSHRALMMLIVNFALDRRLLPIFTTHSPDIVASLEDGDSVSLSRRSGHIFAPKTAEAKVRVLARLGLVPTSTSYIFVEDVVGKIVLEELLALFDFQLVSKIEVIVIPGGAGAINVALGGLPMEVPVASLFGVLDGDMKDQVAGWATRDRIGLTPFVDAPELELLSAMEDAPVAFAKKVQRGTGQIQLALADTVGADHHDRMKAVAGRLGLSEDAMIRYALQHWIATRRKKAAVRQFAKDLAALMQVTPPDL